MGKVKYLLGRLMHMNYRSMFETVGKLHEKTGKNSLWLFGDMVNCGLRYGAGYKDYILCEFYNLTAAQRATYVTRGVNNRIVKLCNDPAWYHCVEDKTEFNSLYGKFVHRGWLDMEESSYEQFAAFMAERETGISKPTAATCGKGIEKLNKGDFDSLQKMYDHLKASGSGLIEDFIIQHPDDPGSCAHHRETYG